MEIAPYTPREPDAGATTTQRRAVSNASGTCTSTRCGWLAPSTFTSAENSRPGTACRSEEHTSELQSLMSNSSADFCLNKKNSTTSTTVQQTNHQQKSKY